MKNKSGNILVIIGIIVGSLIGIIFVKSEWKKEVDGLNKEKIMILQKAKTKELALNYTIDSLKTEIIYLKSCEIFKNAHSLSDLGLVATLLDSDNAGFDSYSLICKFHPDVTKQLYQLGLKFFSSEVRTISSRKEFENFKDRYQLVGNIVPIFSLDLGDILNIYWEKKNKFGK